MVASSPNCLWKKFHWMEDDQLPDGDFASFSSESAAFQETPLPWLTQEGWSPQGDEWAQVAAACALRQVGKAR